MKRSRKILLSLLVIFVALQFFRPAKNINEEENYRDDITSVYMMSHAHEQLFVTKCYDCHSNTTAYPWYFNIQPIGLWMAHHINEGKEELNFSEFKTYSPKKRAHKLEEISEVLTDGTMPLDSYLWMHSHAKMAPEEVEVLQSWIKRNLDAGKMPK